MVLACLFFSVMSISFADCPRDKAGNCIAVYLPIQNISLTYGLKTQSLHVAAHHPSVNPSSQYVRMMTVSVNGQQASTQNYDHQNGQDFSDDVSLKANPGDVITVTLYCTGGMSKSQDLTVAASAGQDTDKVKDKETDDPST